MTTRPRPRGPLSTQGSRDRQAQGSRDRQTQESRDHQAQGPRDRPRDDAAGSIAGNTLGALLQSRDARPRGSPRLYTPSRQELHAQLQGWTPEQLEKLRETLEAGSLSTSWHHRCVNDMCDIWPAPLWRPRDDAHTRCVC